MKAIRVHAPGGPESMKLEEVPVPAPAAGRLEIVEREGATVRVGTVVARVGMQG